MVQRKQIKLLLSRRISNLAQGAEFSPPLRWWREVPILDVDKMLSELRLEREQLEEAILTLERLARGRGRRRGRPPSWLKEATAVVSAAGGDEDGISPAIEPKRRGRPPGSKTKHPVLVEN